MAHAENAVEDDLLGFPDQRHGHGQGQQRKKRQRPKAEAIQPVGRIAERRLQLRELQEYGVAPAEKQKANEQPAVEGGEQQRLVAERLIRQHRAELFEDDVQIEQKKQRRQREHKNRRVEKRLARHFILPEKKRAQTEIDEAKKLRAVEGVEPGAFLFLKIAHVPEAVEQQTGAGQGGDHAQRSEPFGARRFRANDQRHGQSPKQGGKSTREPSERMKQFSFVAGLGFWISRFGQAGSGFNRQFSPAA